MKILYAIQGTGNGHVSRAREIVPIMMKYADVDVLISGIQSEVQLQFPIQYKKHGMSFIFGTHGGVSYSKTLNSLKPLTLLKDIQHFPVKSYDIVINDFEPLTAWACKLRGKDCLGLSHQASFLSTKTPRPIKKDWFAEAILRNYAPVTKKIGFHFKPYDTFINTPVIRKEIRQLNPSQGEHYTVYLPAYGDEILISELTKLKDVKWEVFSKHSTFCYKRSNVFIKPINNEGFLKSLEKSRGLLTNGGFEGPSEALFLGKKVMAIPMTNQYEQQCNALALLDVGGSMVKKIDANFNSSLHRWINETSEVNVHFPDKTEAIIQNILLNYVDSKVDLAL
ncbi:MAG: glycosyltransferase family protein [Bacteroidota bacterium]|jgi:uncharacterized protein (TIGR00661 family)